MSHLAIIKPMRILKAVTDFLFGKDPEIFDEKGTVHHKLPKKKWDDWQSRYIKGQDYNWRSHKGIENKPDKLV